MPLENKFATYKFCSDIEGRLGRSDRSCLDYGGPERVTIAPSGPSLMVIVSYNDNGASGPFIDHCFVQ